MVKPEVLAIIPARGGSKGIPRKNIREFAGYPLIAYSIAAGLKAQSVTRVIVSTDDAEIAETARAWGAEVPFMRPDEFAQDSTLDLPVFEHALRWLSEHEGYRPDVVLQLRPTSPVRPPDMVDNAVRLLLEHPEADSVRGIVPAGQNPHKMWKIDPQTGQMRNLLDVPGIPEPYNAPRQVLPPVYWQTGHIDAIRPRAILEQNSMSGKVILPLMIDPRYTVDIDNLWDWARYEWLVWHGGLDMVTPGRSRRPYPQDVRLVVFDFDGVITDNRVWVDASGRESVASNRSDSHGISLLRQAGMDMLVISREVDPVVTTRCNKIKVPALQGVLEKAGALRQAVQERGIDLSQVIYVGNDVIDLPCFDIAGWAVAVADSHPAVLRAADYVLSMRGGHGAVRELCDLVLNTQRQRSL
ncbi:MAG TPA: acylneuraminate cytidylyltransferase [Anaerolineaceae bacterium]